MLAGRWDFHNNPTGIVPACGPSVLTGSRLQNLHDFDGRDVPAPVDLLESADQFLNVFHAAGSDTIIRRSTKGRVRPGKKKVFRRDFSGLVFSRFLRIKTARV